MEGCKTTKIIKSELRGASCRRCFNAEHVAAILYRVPEPKP